MYTLVELLNDKGVIGLATWIMLYGNDRQKKFVKGELAKL